MRIQITPDSVKLWASANDTYEWAHRPGALWPCSTLSGRRFFAEFDSNGLLDLSIDGRSSAYISASPGLWIDGHELSAICADLLYGSGKVPESHPSYCVAIGQHLSGKVT